MIRASRAASALDVVMDELGWTHFEAPPVDNDGVECHWNEEDEQILVVRLLTERVKNLSMDRNF